MPEATNRTRSALARARCGSSHMAILLCLTGMLCIAPAVDAGPLFKWVDDKGVVHYSERLPTEATGKAAAQLNSQGAVI
jgi:hypothetical protein